MACAAYAGRRGSRRGAVDLTLNGCACLRAHPRGVLAACWTLSGQQSGLTAPTERTRTDWCDRKRGGPRKRVSGRAKSRKGTAPGDCHYAYSGDEACASVPRSLVSRAPASLHPADMHSVTGQAQTCRCAPRSISQGGTASRPRSLGKRLLDEIPDARAAPAATALAIAHSATGAPLRQTHSFLGTLPCNIDQQPATYGSCPCS